MPVGCEALFHWSTGKMDAYWPDMILLVFLRGNPLTSIRRGRLGDEGQGTGEAPRTRHKNVLGNLMHVNVRAANIAACDIQKLR